MQVTPKSIVGSGLKLNLSEIVWLSLLPAKIKKTGAQDASQHFSYYKSTGAMGYYGNQRF